jgi:hypothetical protein
MAFIGCSLKECLQWGVERQCGLNGVEILAQMSYAPVTSGQEDDILLAVRYVRLTESTLRHALVPRHGAGPRWE